MIVKKHLRPAEKADMRRAAALQAIDKKALKPVGKVANAAKAAAENRNPEKPLGRTSAAPRRLTCRLYFPGVQPPNDQKSVLGASAFDISLFHHLDPGRVQTWLVGVQVQRLHPCQMLVGFSGQ